MCAYVHVCMCMCVNVVVCECVRMTYVCVRTCSCSHVILILLPTLDPAPPLISAISRATGGQLYSAEWYTTSELPAHRAVFIQLGLGTGVHPGGYLETTLPSGARRAVKASSDQHFHCTHPFLFGLPRRCGAQRRSERTRAGPRPGIGESVPASRTPRIASQRYTALFPECHSARTAIGRVHRRADTASFLSSREHHRHSAFAS
jgi:hypothetical protein